MAWSWSHTVEAYKNACDNVHRKSRKWLRTVWSEIQARIPDDVCEDGFDLEKYKKAHRESYRIHSVDLADAIWEFMEEFATSDNGGFNAYCCPWGCHMVSFDPEKGHIKS